MKPRFIRRHRRLGAWASKRNSCQRGSMAARGASRQSRRARFGRTLGTLVVGVELLAANLLHEAPPDATAGRYDSARSAFETVLELSATSGSTYLPGIAGATILAYAGPHHLASLLLAASDGLALASLFAVPPPLGANNQTWNSWLKSRAKLAPFIWPNHREAIAKGFYQSGVSVRCRTANRRRKNNGVIP